MNFGARAASRETVFRAAMRGSAWTVTKNGVLYGDYFSRDQAIRSACMGALAVEATGGVARVLAEPGDELIAHGTAGSGRA